MSARWDAQPPRRTSWGYEIWLIGDGCASFADVLHRRAERRFSGCVLDSLVLEQWLACGDGAVMAGTAAIAHDGDR